MAGDNPWRAWTLEWATSSPPPLENFKRLPPVRGRRPLWDLAHPENPDEKSAAPVSPPEKAADKNLVGMLSFIASEATFFLMLILAYLFYNVVAPFGGKAVVLDVQKTGIYTLCLLASSVTLWRAEKSLQRGREGSFKRWLAGTIALGGIFLIGQGLEYAHLWQTGVKMNTSLYSTSFFTLTGFHGLHVCVGLLALLILLRLAMMKDFRKPAEAVASIGLYWHFVDVVWIVVFSIVYLRPLL